MIYLSAILFFYSFITEMQGTFMVKKIESKEKVFNTRLLPVFSVVAFLHKKFLQYLALA